MIHVIGQRSCPEADGVDRGIQVVHADLDAWRKGEPPPAEVWGAAAVARRWKAHVGS